MAATGPSIWVSITGYGRQHERVAFGDDAAVAGGLVAIDEHERSVLRRRCRRRPLGRRRGRERGHRMREGGWPLARGRVDGGRRRLGRAGPDRGAIWEPAEHPRPRRHEHSPPRRRGRRPSNERDGRRRRSSAVGPDVRPRSAATSVIDGRGGALMPGSARPSHPSRRAGRLDVVGLRRTTDGSRRGRLWPPRSRPRTPSAPPGAGCGPSATTRASPAISTAGRLDRLVQQRPVRVQHRSGALWMRQLEGVGAPGLARRVGARRVRGRTRRHADRSAVAARPLVGGDGSARRRPTSARWVAAC